MALTIQEQLSILNGNVKPDQADASFNLQSIVQQIAFNQAQEFYKNAENPNQQSAGEAFDYVSKMYGVCDNVINSSRPQIFNTFAKILIAIYADTGVIATVQSTDTDGWVNFLTNTMEATFELYAGVKTYEKAAYDLYVSNLP